MKLIDVKTLLGLQVMARTAAGDFFALDAMRHYLQGKQRFNVNQSHLVYTTLYVPSGSSHSSASVHIVVKIPCLTATMPPL